MEFKEDLDEEEEMEFSVYVDFGSQLSADELADPETQVKIIGLQTEKPIAQINGRFYQGGYDFALGTKLFFAPDDRELPTEWFSKSTSSERFYLADKTSKVVKMNRIFVVSKQNKSEEGLAEVKEETNSKKYEIEATYSEVLGKFLPEGRKPPRELSAEENGDEFLRKEKDTETEKIET